MTPVRPPRCFSLSADVLYIACPVRLSSGAPVATTQWKTTRVFTRTNYIFLHRRSFIKVRCTQSLSIDAGLVCPDVTVTKLLVVTKLCRVSSNHTLWRSFGKVKAYAVDGIANVD